MELRARDLHRARIHAQPAIEERDAYAAKLDSNGVLQWNTFSAPASDDRGKAIAVDSSNNVYVAGTSYASWGTPVRAFFDGFDVFVAKLNPSGALQWNTFLGNEGNSLALGAGGSVYVAGTSGVNWGDAQTGLQRLRGCIRREGTAASG